MPLPGERRAREIVAGQASLDPLVTISPGGRITDVNEAAVRVTGAAREELIGSDFSNCFTEPEKARECHRRVLAEGSVRDYPLTIRGRTGRLTDVLCNAALYRDARGKVIGVFAAARDITPQKEAFQYARSLIEASLDPLVTISPGGKIMDVNEAAVKATGVARGELIGSDFSDYFTEPERARDAYKRVFAEGSVTDYALTIRARSGRLTYVIYNASLYRDTQGKVLGVFAAARDVTENAQLRKAADEIRSLNAALQKRAVELEGLNRELEAFSYSVSHDLRAPLRAIDGFSQALIEDYSRRLDEDGLRYLKRMREGTQRMGRLIDDMLKLSRLTRMEMNPGEVDLSAIAGEIAAELRQTQTERKVEFAISPNLKAHADPRLLRIALENLLENAWKFTGTHPTARIEFGATEWEGKKIYFVRDDGVGFDMAYAGKLFGAFQRLHNEREFPGNGIGLATVRRVISKHGGLLWAEAKPGKGAVFYFTLE